MASRSAIKRPSIAQSVRAYIDSRPVVRDALRMGIVNLSALTRRIQRDLEIRQEEAVLVACRRYEADPTVKGYEEAIRRVLDGAKLEVRTRVAVWTLRSSWRLFGRLEKAVGRMQGQATPVHILHGSEAVTVIADETAAPKLEEVLEPDDVIAERRGVVEVNIRTQEEVEEVPGMLAFLTGSLSGRGINFLEVVSCHKDNMFIITEEDLFTAFEVLNDLIRS